MAKRAKLKDALDRQKGVDHKLEQQKRQQKKALKRKRDHATEDDANDDEDDGDQVQSSPDATTIAEKKPKKSKLNDDAAGLGNGKIQSSPKLSEEDEGWETAEEDLMHTALDLSRLQDSDTSDSEEDDDEDGSAPTMAARARPSHTKHTTNGHVPISSQTIEGDDNEGDAEDIPLSDIESLASEDKADVIPHQRLTINNISALTQAYKSIALPASLPFSTMQAVTSEEPVVIADIDDDLKRESTFYKQSLEAVTRARALLKKEGISFARPADYFAEMVKTDEHMGKIKKKLVDDAAGKKAAADARRQRDLKKFGKQVQIAKLQERQKEKRTTLDQIKMLKRKRSGAAIGNEKEDDIFDVGLEDSAETARKDKADRRASGGPTRFKRQKKDEKYGYGGKKRFAKSNDAVSSADTRGFSIKKMKGKSSARPGKSKRAKAR